MDKQRLSLNKAAIQFLSSIPPERRQKSQQELIKFVRWCGGERLISDLNGQEIANYVEGLGKMIPDLGNKVEPIKNFLAYAKKKKFTETNLATHIRVTNWKNSTMSRKKAEKERTSKTQITLTPEGYAELKSQIASLKSERLHLIEDIRLAAADKDVRENAPLEAAREARGQVEARIRELEDTLKKAAILGEEIERESSENQKVKTGSVTTIHNLELQEDFVYTLVYSFEANPSQGRLSTTSPLGQALMGHKEGEIVEVSAPSGISNYRIEKIERG